MDTVKQDLYDLTEKLNSLDLIQPLKGSRVMITGATGFLGSMLVKTLHEVNIRFDAGIRIIASARDTEKAGAVLGDAAQSEDVSIVCGMDAESDSIIHTISPTRSAFFISHPVETIRSSVLTTMEILEAARNNDASMVFLSSMEQYGSPYVPGETVTEDRIGIIDHLNVRSSYSESKRLCECLCASYASEYDVDVKIARLAQTYGAGAPLSDNRMPMQFASAAAEGRDIVLHTEGKSISNCVYITDAVSGILTVLLKGSKGEAYNICNDREIKSVHDIAQTIAQKVAGGRISVVIDIPETNMGYAPPVEMYLSSQKLRALGWNADYGLKEGYSRLVKYIQDGRTRETRI